jgi:flagellar basal body-associated protein FliL
MKPAPLLSSLVALLWVASPALAQAPSKAPEGNAWIAVVIAIVLVIAVGVASFMSSKRTHQD